MFCHGLTDICLQNNTAALLAGRGGLDIGVGGVAAPVAVVDGGGGALLGGPVTEADGIDDAEESTAGLATPEQVGL